MTVNEEKIVLLRESLKAQMSPKRYRHTVAVEAMAEMLGKLYLPEKTGELRLAALLHDITKEFDEKSHLEVFEAHGIMLSEEELLAPKTFHAMSAAALIGERYAEFASDEIVSAVRWHTTGRAKMTLFDKLIYLADYIDMSRTFEDCVRLREMFFSAEPEKMSEAERIDHLDRVLVASFDMTVEGLVEKGAVISRDTVSARNDLIIAIHNREKTK